MASSYIVTADAQSTVSTTLKAPTDYYLAYQGLPSDTPIALVPPDGDAVTGYDTYSAVEQGVGAARTDLPTSFQRYMNVAKGSMLNVWFPRVGCMWGPSAAEKSYWEQSYQYTFHWRLRCVKDYRFNQTPFTITDRTSITTFGGRLWVPSARGPVVTPIIEGDGYLPLTATGKNPLSSARFVGGTPSYAPTFDDWYGDSYFRPLQVPCLGDQMLLTVRRTNNELGVYNFAAPALDAAFDITYGRSEYNDANPPAQGQDRSQAISPGAGVIIFCSNTGY
jgi:hypothetical protein